MHQRTAENRLSIAYAFCVVVGATASITAGIAWGHWKETLDQCVNKNCSCILYAKHTQTRFLGGDAAPCIWVTFGPLIYVLISVGFACYHGFRVLFGVRTTTRRTITTKNEVGETIVIDAAHTDDTKPLPRAYWIFASIVSVFFIVYALAHFAVYMDGYLSTCKEYRSTLTRELGTHGTLIPIIYGRLACNAVYDFMDYIQPDTGNAYRDGFINTAADLIIGIISSLFGVVFFVIISFINITFARLKR